MKKVLAALLIALCLVLAFSCKQDVEDPIETFANLPVFISDPYKGATEEAFAIQCAIEEFISNFNTNVFVCKEKTAEFVITGKDTSSTNGVLKIEMDASKHNTSTSNFTSETGVGGYWTYKTPTDVVKYSFNGKLFDEDGNEAYDGYISCSSTLDNYGFTSCTNEKGETITNTTVTNAFYLLLRHFFDNSNCLCMRLPGEDLYSSKITGTFELMYPITSNPGNYSTYSDLVINSCKVTASADSKTAKDNFDNFDETAFLAASMLFTTTGENFQLLPTFQTYEIKLNYSDATNKIPNTDSGATVKLYFGQSGMFALINFGGKLMIWDSYSAITN